MYSTAGDAIAETITNLKWYF